MKILVIDEWIPYPLDNGKKIRTFNLLKHLIPKHSIDYLCFADYRSQERSIRHLASAGINVIPVEGRRPRGKSALYAELLLNSFSRRPYSVHKHFSAQFRAVMLKLLDKDSYDLIQCEWTPYSAYLAHVSWPPKVLCTHSVEMERLKRFAQVQGNPIAELLLRIQAWKMFRFEKTNIHRFDFCTAVSERDKEFLARWYGCHDVVVVPNGVDTSFYEGNFGEEDYPSLVYCASMDSYGNQDAVRYFVQEVFPKVLCEIPRAKFLVVGRSPPARILALESPTVKVTGTVDDVRPYLARASVIVIPLRVAGGSRLKILEAMAMGKPVVSTAVGAEGLSVLHGENILIGSTSDSVARNIKWVLRNDGLRASLGANGRKLVRHRYDWAYIAPRLEEAWLKAITKGRSRNCRRTERRCLPCSAASRR